ncbi:MAG: UDP-3-O-(3-hydroxymyristoyl)glucosamine N-acyltransferase [Ignavibacteriae bacterium]|nr:UDP-3-O-(3-hydroxymyristoyl)glucosamine N-acyltransferase [Ignavibacteriota bacterium]
MTVGEIASWLNGEVVGDSTKDITRVAKIEEARAGELTFLANPKYERFLSSTKASVVLVSKAQQLDLAHGKDANGAPAFIRVEDPYIGFLRVLDLLTPKVDPFPEGIHPSAIIAKSAKLGKNVVLGANVVVDEGAVIGDETKISHGCIIGKSVQIGAGCLLYPRVTVYHQCRIGSRVIIHSGTVIGSDGFGWAPKPDGTYEKIPQLGIVIVEDDVSIGANCCIDRATVGETVIKRGVKLDNLIQIAHNCTVGEDTVIAAQTGLAGSTKIGKHNMIGGQVGFAGHMEMADNSIFLAQSGVTKSFTQPGQMYTGYPAKEVKKSRRIEAALRSLPELAREFEELKKKVAQLFEKLK